MSETACVAINTTLFRPVVQTHGRMPEFTRRVVTIFVSTLNVISFVRIFLFVAFSPSVCFAFGWGVGEDDRLLSS